MILDEIYCWSTIKEWADECNSRRGAVPGLGCRSCQYAELCNALKHGDDPCEVFEGVWA